MIRNRPPSSQALNVLAVLIEAGGSWRHGYDIAAEAGLKSGTLYPLLLRLESQGYLEAEWQDSPVPGRPPRHAYRLTAAGVEFAMAAANHAGGANARPAAT